MEQLRSLMILHCSIGSLVDHSFSHLLTGIIFSERASRILCISMSESALEEQNVGPPGQH